MYPTNRGLFHGTHQRQYYLDDDLAENNGNVSTIQGGRQGTVRFETQRDVQQILASNGHYKEHWRREKGEQIKLERMSHCGDKGQDPTRKAQPHKAKRPTERAAIKPIPTYLGPGCEEGEKNGYQEISQNEEEDLHEEEGVKIQQGRTKFNQMGKSLMEREIKEAPQLHGVLNYLLNIEVHPGLGRMFTEVRSQLQCHLNSWEEWQTARYHEELSLIHI